MPPTTILVVDDNEANRFAVGAVLRRDGHHVVEAEDGSGALRALSDPARLPDLALLDVRLPDMSGFDVCSRIKSVPATADIPVVHISAAATELTDHCHGLNAGADAYLFSPVLPEQLLATVRAALRRTWGSRQATLRATEAMRAYDEERRLAQLLQRSLLPGFETLPPVAGLELSVGYRPRCDVVQIGGDFYTAVQTDERVCVAIGDVAGHSWTASRVMVDLWHAVRVYSLEGHSPDEILRRLDRLLTRLHDGYTATMLIAHIDPARGRMELASAGHLPPLLCRGEDGTAGYLDVEGPLLGLEMHRPEPTEAKLDAGDRLLMFTDGLIEQRGVDLTHSMERLSRAAARAADGELDAMRDRLLSSYDTQSNDDDAAVLLLRLA
ncbi:fused response regulator/phosphatase [Streptomyces sp. A7024]|uniref:Fused response regulator/phosphatase n=1 Tax=Streptomyces coryli TaxID=1128680 RepID=A0A6G4TRZ6_9ACTN|nr:fused response regulator/phosphatase [Streptomyces coryli]NGN62765.1 fused response regulator/phosphatase [Streptomyces coryli]